MSARATDTGLVVPDTRQAFLRDGWVLTDVLSPAAVVELASWVDEVASWARAPDSGLVASAASVEAPPVKGLHYHEMTDYGPVLCRSEDFVLHHDGLRVLLTAGALADTASLLLGEPAVLYKEKVNYKLPGGAGFSPHQDAPAYRFVDAHVSCMLAIDDATPDNGCLEVVTGAHTQLLPSDESGCIRPEVVASLPWVQVPVRAGQALWFHSRAPHRSGPNRSSRPRRALYPTYNAASEGDLRADYYRQKQSELAAAVAAGLGSDRVALSLIGDFQGRPVH